MKALLLLLAAAAGPAGAGGVDRGCTFATHDWNAARTLKSISAATPAACCAACAATPGCAAGTLAATGQCYLKAGLQSATGCHNCTSCTLPGPSGARSLEFGPKRFRLTLNAKTLGLQNISVGSADGAFTQGMIMNTGAIPQEYALWSVNITDCKSALPEGTRVTAVTAGGDSGNTSHSVSVDGSTLTLRWEGVPLPPPFTVRLDVTVTIAQLPNGKPGVSLRGAVGLSSGAEREQVCLQTMALPTLDRILLRSEATDQMFVPDFFGQSSRPPPLSDSPQSSGTSSKNSSQFLL